MNKKLPSATPLLGLKAQDRAYVEQRQHGNGYKDIDGLHDDLQARGAEVSRATAGRMNAYLKAQAEDLLEKKQALKTYLDALGPNGNDAGLVNIALFTDYLMDMSQDMLVSPEELKAMPANQRLAVFFKMVEAQRQLAQAQKPLRTERRVDMKEAEEKLVAMEKAAKSGESGLDVATLQKVRQQIYGFEL